MGQTQGAWPVPPNLRKGRKTSRNRNAIRKEILLFRPLSKTNVQRNGQKRLAETGKKKKYHVLYRKTSLESEHTKRDQAIVKTDEGATSH